MTNDVSLGALVTICEALLSGQRRQTEFLESMAQVVFEIDKIVRAAADLQVQADFLAWNARRSASRLARIREEAEES